MTSRWQHVMASSQHWTSHGILAGQFVRMFSKEGRKCRVYLIRLLQFTCTEVWGRSKNNSTIIGQERMVRGRGKVGRAVSLCASHRMGHFHGILLASQVNLDHVEGNIF